MEVRKINKIYSDAILSYRHCLQWRKTHFLLFFFNGWLSDFQLDAQNSYLFIYNTFIKILYVFRALPCSSSGGLLRNCVYAASGIVTLCRWLSCAPVKKELQFFLNRCTEQSPAESDDTRGCTYKITTQTSWKWAEQCSKHVEDFNKCIMHK